MKSKSPLFVLTLYFAAIVALGTRTLLAQPAFALQIHGAVEIEIPHAPEQENLWFQLQQTTNLNSAVWVNSGSPFRADPSRTNQLIRQTSAAAFYRSVIVGTNGTATLVTWVESFIKSTGEVVLNGVETSPLGVPPFHFDWGDGSSSDGGFAQKHTYTDNHRDYVVTTTSRYADGTVGTVMTVVTFPPAETMAIFLSTIDTKSGDVTINGGESSTRALTPFLFLWGDDTCTEGLFPQHHKFPSVSKNYVIKVLVRYSDGVFAENDLVIKFTP